MRLKDLQRQINLLESRLDNFIVNYNRLLEYLKIEYVTIPGKTIIKKKTEKK